MLKNNKGKYDPQNFFNLVCKLEVNSFIGVARILQVDICEKVSNEDLVSEKIDGDTKQELEFKEFEVLLGDMVQAFTNLARAQRKDLIKVMTQAIKEQKDSKGE